MYKLKKEYKQFIKANTETVKECDAIFYENHSEYLNIKKLPQSWKTKIDHLWYSSPMAKIADGWHNEAMMYYEVTDLRNDSACKNNLNKEYWLKAYMMQWAVNLPDRATDDFLFNHLRTRESNRLLIEKAYQNTERK